LIQVFCRNIHGWGREHLNASPITDTTSQLRTKEANARPTILGDFPIVDRRKNAMTDSFVKPRVTMNNISAA
jgi:hypothetical protein